MKRLIILFSCLNVITSLMANAQDIDLTKLPQPKRDNIAIQIAISAMKKYAPSYYHESLVPAVYEDYFRNDQDKNYGKIQYTVGFPFDLRKAVREDREGENIYGAAVYIVGETGKVVAIHPNGWMTLFEIPEVTTRSGGQEIAPPMTVPRNPFKK